MRAGVAYCRGLSFEGLCVGRTTASPSWWLPATSSCRSASYLPQSPAILRWELITILGGVFLFFAAPELPYQWLWMVTAGGMIAKGGFLSIGRPYWRGPVIAWCVSREDVDYRFWRLGLCALAVLLLYELG